MLRRLPILCFCIIVAAAVAGCRGHHPAPTRVIRVWCHQGQEAENRAMRAIATDFNRAHAAEGIAVDLTFFPDFQFTEKIAIAAAAGDLPDAFDIDGPLVARYVAAGLLTPLDRWFSPADRADFLPTILAQGTIGGKLYAVGAFDSAAVLYFDRSLLARAGVTPPPDGQTWSWTEFLAACGRLRAAGIQPVALHMNESADEWFTYAFSPVVWSGGGALITPDGRTVRGILASPANVRSLTAWQQLFRERYALADPVDPDPFDHGTVAMDWSGHWLAGPHLAAKGKNLGAMPLPRTGAQPVAPCGSWCWGVSARARQPELAALWVRWVTDTPHGIVPIVRA
ncbi:MAG TPA: sugar ABC transporter substrate-binding protein, partial [Opitutaceae bacterium]|nr:sugar ABC transporter substrate-binding protein [Opitutaceae bacterium]